MRLQLALNVDDLDEAISFYEKMFGTAVNKVCLLYTSPSPRDRG